MTVTHENTRPVVDLTPGSEPIRIDATDADISAMNSVLRQGSRVANENVEKDLHLNEMISKPWGQEYRIYVDDFLDVWHLRIDPRQSTSMHSHPRKTTYLLCLAGSGITHTLDRSIAVAPGTVLRIGRGAFHATENTAEDKALMIAEVETPRNKYDLLRLRDSYDRAGQGYETAGCDAPTATKRIPFLPNAQLRKISPCGGFAFDIHSGMDIHYRRGSAGAYLIPLGIEDLIADRMAILTDHPADTRRPNLDCHYLSIRPMT